MRRLTGRKGDPSMSNPSLTVAASVTAQPQPRTHLAPVDHAEKAIALQGEWGKRLSSNVAATAQLLMLGMDRETWGELLEIGASAQERLAALQQTWLQQWVGWVQYADQIKGANTMAKFADRESNIAAQWSQLLGTQAASLIGLEENLEVAYSYWLSEKLAAKKRALIE